MLWKYVRATGRLIHFCWAIGAAVADFFFRVHRRKPSAGVGLRAAWMAKHAHPVLKSINVEVTSHGQPPKSGFLAANHLGYLDILVLGSLQPTVFLSKSEVRQWPVIGFVTSLAGTLFIRRDRKSDVVRFDDSFAEVIKAGLLLGIFPEGTSTDGHRVLPFRSSMFAAAAANQWHVTPAWIGYEAEGGTVERDVSYWGDMTFFSHLGRLLTVTKIKATVVYGETLPPGLDRKQIAQHLHHEICRLAEKHRPGLLHSASPAGDSSAMAPAHS